MCLLFQLQMLIIQDRQFRELFDQLFQKKVGGLNSIEFGAEQAILVRDEETKRKVFEKTGGRVVVLIVVEAKGGIQRLLYL